MLRRKEWKLLRRDKWLMSQTLMQLLYLIPPAFMLWHSFGQGSSMTLVDCSGHRHGGRTIGGRTIMAGDIRRRCS